MTTSLAPKTYSPGDFGRELRALAEAERSLRAQFANLEKSGGSTESFSQSLSTLSMGLHAWKDSFDKSVDELVATMMKADFAHVTDGAKPCLEAYGKDLLPMLASIVSNQELNWQIRGRSTHFIGELGQEALPILPILSKLVIEDPDLDMRVWGCYPLGCLGAIAIPALVMAFRLNSNEDVKNQVAASLGRIGLEAAPALQEVARDPNRRVQESAIKALNAFGKDALPFLVELLEENPEMYLQERIGDAFGRLDPNDLPELIKILRAKHGPLVRLWIARTFEWNGTVTGAASYEAEFMLRELMRRHSDEDFFITWAQKAIDRIGLK